MAPGKQKLFCGVCVVGTSSNDTQKPQMYLFFDWDFKSWSLLVYLTGPYIE